MSTFSVPPSYMDSFRLFPDLPQIHVDENGPLNDGYAYSAFGGDPDADWNPMTSRKLPSRFINISGTEVPLQHRNTQIMSNMERFLLDPDKSACAPGLLPDYYRTNGLNSNTNALDFIRPYEAQEPYPFYYGHPRYSSPDGSWSADRSATEYDSSCGGSVWSPRTSQGDMDLEYLRGYRQVDTSYPKEHDIQPPNLGQLCIGYSPGFSGHYSHERSVSDPFVALRDVQQYPDAEPEEQNEEYEYMDVKPEYYLEPSQVPYKLPTEIIHVGRHYDETTGSSSHGDGLTPESIRDEEEAMSDYQPPATTKRRRGRSTQESSVSPTSPITKRVLARSPQGSNKVTKRSKAIPATTNSPTTCPTHPSKTFKSASEYRKHIQTSHTRPFVCTFSVYGCNSTFGSKNEWKRHVTSQHLRLGFWRCDLGACAHDPARPNDFNRKDLFTQHVRRMHAPGPKASRPERERWEAGLEALRQRCWVKSRETPEKSECGFCGCEEAGGRKVAFEGAGSWEERMEHVGRHFEKGDGARLVWKEDVGLRDWMVGEGLLERVGGCSGSGNGKFRLTGLKEERRLLECDEDAEAEEE